MYTSSMEKGKGGENDSGCFRLCMCSMFPCLDVKKKKAIKEGESSLISGSSHGGHSVSSTHSSSHDSGSSMLHPGKAVLFTMSELNRATSNFSVSCKVGQGGFGTVYRGKLRDGSIVAIKRARKDVFQTLLTEQFESEINMLANIDHLNLVRLIGYIEEGNERILVEEFVANHNLREHLDCKFGVILDLSQRIDIAIDIAHALTYLHLYADRPIIHRDVKSSNILLTETFRAKVVDFGFSRVGPTETNATHVMTKVKGTAGYLDPEYLKTYKLTTKSDVYAFGILLLEIFSGRRPIEQNRGLNERITVRWAYDKFTHSEIMEIMDPNLQFEKSDAIMDLLQKLFEFAFQCSAPTRQDRPTMKETAEVLWSIRKAFRLLPQRGRQTYT